MPTSELKTSGWRITSTFASVIPVEEQLRQLVPVAGETNAPQANIEQAARHLGSLIRVLKRVSPQNAELPAEQSVQGTP